MVLQPDCGRRAFVQVFSLSAHLANFHIGLQLHMLIRPCMECGL